MVGPSATEMRPRSAPQRSMAAIVASSTPVAAPRQPAWAAPITPAVSSANRTGPQSAVVTPIASPRAGAAVGGGGGGGEPRAGGPDRVGARPLVRLPRPLEGPHVGGMPLVGGEQVIRRAPERRCHARAVLRPLGGRVVGAWPAVEAR